MLQIGRSRVGDPKRFMNCLKLVDTFIRTRPWGLLKLLTENIPELEKKKVKKSAAGE
jgi:hypothetical protein